MSYNDEQIESEKKYATALMHIFNALVANAKPELDYTYLAPLADSAVNTANTLRHLSSSSDFEEEVKKGLETFLEVLHSPIKKKEGIDLIDANSMDVQRLAENLISRERAANQIVQMLVLAHSPQRFNSF